MKYNPNIHHRRSIRLKGYDYSQAGAYYVTICIQNRECRLGQIRNGIVGLSKAGIMVYQIWFNLENIFDFINVDEFIVMPNHVHGVIVLSNPKSETTEIKSDLKVGTGLRACPDDKIEQIGKGSLQIKEGEQIEEGQGQIEEGQARIRKIEEGQARIRKIEEGQARIRKIKEGQARIRQIEEGQARIRKIEEGQARIRKIEEGQARRPVPTLGSVVGQFKSFTTKLYGEGVRSAGWPPYEKRLWQQNYYEHIIRNEDELHRIREYIYYNPLKWMNDPENPDVIKKELEAPWQK
ncbi:hypothetical protein J7L05_10360 [bacterium]|nr:hypothetical protein [bacterium]